MALMEFLNVNLINTDTMINPESGTDVVSSLFDNNRKITWSSVNYNANTDTTLKITFAITTPVSHVLLINHNLESCSVYRNGNSLSAVTSFLDVSNSSTYLVFSTIQASSIELTLEGTQNGGEYSIGELIISNREVVFERNPSTENFSPTVKRMNIKHTMPDGGVVMYNIKDKFNAGLDFTFITTSFKNQLLDIYESGLPYVFVPFPTTGTQWDGNAYETLWTNDFDFKHSENSKNQGFSGSIHLGETPSA